MKSIREFVEVNVFLGSKWNLALSLSYKLTFKLSKQIYDIIYPILTRTTEANGKKKEKLVL